jgi:hypothetical protein
MSSDKKVKRSGAFKVKKSSQRKSQFYFIIDISTILIPLEFFEYVIN